MGYKLLINVVFLGVKSPTDPNHLGVWISWLGRKKNTAAGVYLDMNSYMGLRSVGYVDAKPYS